MVKLKQDLKRKDPAYRLYTADFLVRNLDMTNEQIGKYIRLLCLQHQNGHLIEDTMMSFCKFKDELIFSKFIKDERGLYYNDEMEIEVLRRADVKETKAGNAYKRWEKKEGKIKEENYPLEEIEPYEFEYDNDDDSL